MTIADLKQLKESEDKVEFKEAKNQYAYKSSRKSVLGYTVAFANEKGGYLVFGLEDEVLKVEGKIKGARYSIAGKFADLRGDVLLNAVIAELRSKYE